MKRHKRLKIVAIGLYALMTAAFMAIPLWHRNLEPYDYDMKNDIEIRRSLIWGPYGYAYIIPAFVVFFYLLLAHRSYFFGK
jgi:hypothetical protein